MVPLGYDYLSVFSGRINYDSKSGDLDVDNVTRWQGVPARTGESRLPIILWCGKSAVRFAKHEDGYASYGRTYYDDNSVKMTLAEAESYVQGREDAFEHMGNVPDNITRLMLVAVSSRAKPPIPDPIVALASRSKESTSEVVSVTTPQPVTATKMASDTVHRSGVNAAAGR